jgi:hypothetical protein
MIAFCFRLKQNENVQWKPSRSGIKTEKVKMTLLQELASSFRHSILRQQFEEEGKNSTSAIDQMQPMFVRKCGDQSREN